MTLRVFECPFCGYKFRDNPKGRYVNGKVKPVRGEKKAQAPNAQRQRSVDLTCPNCDKDFEVEVEG